MTPTERRGFCVGAAVLFFLLICLIHPPSSQAVVGWLPISPEDLALKDNPKQPGADAMTLYRELEMNASKAATSGDTAEEYVRMKIFTQAGTKYGHIEIEFEKERQNVVYIAGRTIKPDGTIVNFDGQALETTVEKASGRKVLAKAFTLPDVQPGCIIEYKYQMQGQAGWVHSQEWLVSQATYTREAHFTYIPDTSYGNDLHPMYTTYLLPPDAALKQQASGAYSMVVHDIPALVEEPLMPPERPIQARVDFFYESTAAPSATAPSDRYWNYYAKKWDGELEHFIDKKNALSRELSKIVSDSDPPDVKLRKIYERVQKIRNLSMEDYKMNKENKAENLKPNSNVEDVLNRGYAYGTEIDYLFVGLARAAGFEANEVYVAPRNYELFIPTRNEVWQLSDEFSWVRAGSKEYYLDPSARYFPFGLLPWYETATGGIRIDKNGATTIETPASDSSDATIVRNGDLEVKDDGSISGVLRVDFTGQHAGLQREEERKEDETGRKKHFEDEIKGWLPAGSTFDVTKIDDWDDNERPVHVEGKLMIPSASGVAVRQMIFPIEIFQASQTASFAAEQRANAIYFHFPYEETDDIKFHLPSGFKAASLPAERKVDLGAVKYDITATAAQDGSVEVKRQLAVNGLVFSAKEYPTLRRFFGTVKTNDNAQMVLQNAPSAKAN